MQPKHASYPPLFSFCFFQATFITFFRSKSPLQVIQSWFVHISYFSTSYFYFRTKSPKAHCYNTITLHGRGQNSFCIQYTLYEQKVLYFFMNITYSYFPFQYLWFSSDFAESLPFIHTRETYTFKTVSVTWIIQPRVYSYILIKVFTSGPTQF